MRCPYHGWKFGLDGQCVEMPSEPSESGFAAKVRTAAYPCAEAGGVIWAYMGPQDPPPPLPEVADAAPGKPGESAASPPLPPCGRPWCSASVARARWRALVTDATLVSSSSATSARVRHGR